MNMIHLVFTCVEVKLLVHKLVQWILRWSALFVDCFPVSSAPTQTL